MTAEQIVQSFVSKHSDSFKLIGLTEHSQNVRSDLKYFNDAEKAAKRSIAKVLAYNMSDETKTAIAELRKDLAGCKWYTIKGKSARIRLCDKVMIVSGKTKCNGLYITT